MEGEGWWYETASQRGSLISGWMSPEEMGQGPRGVMDKSGEGIWGTRGSHPENVSLYHLPVLQEAEFKGEAGVTCLYTHRSTHTHQAIICLKSWGLCCAGAGLGRKKASKEVSGFLCKKEIQGNPLHVFPT